MTESLRVYHFEPRVTTLGPGVRAGLWLQGCHFGCKGCLVPGSHDDRGGERVTLPALSARILALSGIEGITVSGGEPFRQAAALGSLLDRLHIRRPALTVMVYSGFTLDRLREDAHAAAVLGHTDILVDGVFRQDLQAPDAWRGSTNQRIHFLSPRYGPPDYRRAERNALEFFIGRGGALFMAGVPAPGWLDRLHGALARIGHLSANPAGGRDAERGGDLESHGH